MDREEMLYSTVRFSSSRMRRNKLIFGLAVLIVRFSLAHEIAAQYQFDSWTTDNGLPQISVNSIVQTQDGFLWFATFGGLARYDGLRFEVFNTGNTKGLKSSRFIGLFEDRQTNLWITTEGQGITLYKNGKFRTFTTEDGLPDNYISRVGNDEDGNLLIHCAGKFLRWNGEIFSPISFFKNLPATNILHWNDNGSIWYLDGKTIRKFENGRDRESFTPDFVVKRIFQDSSDRVWITSEKEILQLFENGKVTTFTDREVYPKFSFMSAYEDKQKDIWLIAPDAGLILYKNEKFRRYTTADGLVSNAVTCFYEDREGTLWIGTTGGLNRMQKQTVTAYSTGNGLAADNVYPVIQDRQGRIWIGSWNGLSVYENGRFEDVSRRFEVERAQIMSFLEDREGNLWIGTWGGDVRIIKNGKVKIFPRNQLPTAPMRVIFQDSSGNIWFGTTDGLSRTESSEAKSYVTFTEKDGFTGKDVLAIFEDKNKQLWIGTQSGLFKYKDGAFTKFTEADGFTGEIVRSIYEDADGVLWFGMYDSGIYRLKNGKFTHFTANEGLFDNGAFRILEDADGNFWVSCNVGIYRLKKSELNDFADGKISQVSSIFYNKRDGMLNSECNGGGQPAGIKANDGQLWFPTQKGVAVIDPKAVSLNRQPPPVVIESLLVDAKSVENTPTLTIRPEQVYLEIHYSGLSFIQPELVRFKYKLENWDGDWIDAGTRRTAYFSHLPPGRYIFRVLAANRDGVWNEQAASLEIIVLPPFYQTWWFSVVTALAVALIVFLLYRLRINLLKRAHTAKEEFSRQLIESQETERRRIAAELHDSLGQNLVMIRNWALLGLRATKNKKTNLEEISETASEAIKEVREIAYNLGPYQLERLGLRHAIEEMVQKVAATSTICFQTEIGEIDHCFPKEAEISIYRIAQEAVNNIIKHSRASAADLKIKISEERMILAITDNGQGFASGNSNGFGLLGMKERVNLLKGEMSVHSENGTHIKINLPC
jgi:signal transduction histidine kinase/ligand-binding sensor domain-containing protein